VVSAIAAFNCKTIELQGFTLLDGLRLFHNVPHRLYAFLSILRAGLLNNSKIFINLRFDSPVKKEHQV